MSNTSPQDPNPTLAYSALITARIKIGLLTGIYAAAVALAGIGAALSYQVLLNRNTSDDSLIILLVFAGFCAFVGAATFSLVLLCFRKRMQARFQRTITFLLGVLFGLFPTFAFWFSDHTHHLSQPPILEWLLPWLLFLYSPLAAVTVGLLAPPTRQNPK